MSWLDVTEDLPINVKVGQVLIFDYEGSPVHLKIMRKKDGKVWAKRTYIYLPDEVQITDKNKIDKI